jgi:hypothetical protein
MFLYHRAAWGVEGASYEHMSSNVRVENLPPLKDWKISTSAEVGWKL